MDTLQDKGTLENLPFREDGTIDINEMMRRGLRTARCTLRVVCRGLRTARCTLRVVCRGLRTTRCVPRAVCAT
ncbi:hypothetical protein [Adlercreutzia sp. ZJ304]|uniref:hypothetical protein n=1 Tax=Adlercreutzia sp. ZJ304 TaxID=2709791 RepID=UPI0013EC8E36|nr:hypothetical protein [Adlercreutzia sp. ZJ304]